jgi:hypothetical protein
LLDCVSYVDISAHSRGLLRTAQRYYSNHTDDFNKLTIPYDPDGKGCGKDYPTHPYIYFVSPHEDVPLIINIVAVGDSLRVEMSKKW